MDGIKKNILWKKWWHWPIACVALFILGIVSVIKYFVSVEKFKGGKSRTYLILFNHQTPFDQFFVSMAFKTQIYYLATEDIFSNGFISTLLRFFVAPIPIRKQTIDIGAVKTIIKVAKEGNSIALAPEGSRTFSGRTEYINPSIAKLAKKLNIPIALFRIEGGFAVEPRWANICRKGKIRAYVSEIIEPNDPNLEEKIINGLYVDDNKSGLIIKSNRMAEYMERMVYICPKCGLSEFHSSGNSIRCQTCKEKYIYQENLIFKDCKPFKYISEWYDFQKKYINSHIFKDELLFTDICSLSEVILNKKKVLISRRVPIELWGDRIIIANKIFLFDKIDAITCMGRVKINIYCDGKVHQLKGNKRFNGLKYVHIYNRYKNLNRGEGNAEFLGL